MAGPLEAATITVRNGSRKGESLECAFNPSEYRTEKCVDYGEVSAAGSETSLPQFVGGEAETLSMELFFDTTDRPDEDVRSAIDFLDALVSVDETLHAPPLCRFVWGDGLDFTGVLRRVEKQFTKFRPSGVPVRARVAVTFTEHDSRNRNGSTAPSTPDEETRHRTVTEGDTLWLIAEEEYGDPNDWRPIADRNGLTNPRSLSAGQRLEVPPL